MAGNYDRDGDGAYDSSYIYRITGGNAPRRPRSRSAWRARSASRGRAGIRRGRLPPHGHGGRPRVAGSTTPGPRSPPA
ncbi:MAG: hypothetical protein M0C28_41545 [Candidatus Moduliflexus flocculans]|nr:hypothetical protein [Candidatus Moduliflexus flocculans]